MPVPQKLPQIPVLPAGYPNLRNPILPQQLENMLSSLAVLLMLAHSLGSDLGRIPTARCSVLPAVARTSVRVHWLPSPDEWFLPGWQARGRTSPPARDAPAAALSLLPFLYRHTQFVGSPDGNRILQ